jgi:hypothetical protein
MEALDDALRVGNIDLYNQIKEECWIVDFEDYYEAKNAAFRDANYL